MKENGILYYLNFKYQDLKFFFKLESIFFISTIYNILKFLGENNKSFIRMWEIAVVVIGI